VTDAAADLHRILALASAQRPDPRGWSLTLHDGWIERAFFGPGVVAFLQTATDGDLGACASVRPFDEDDRAAVTTVTSMLRPGCEHLWPEQLAWIHDQMASDAAGLRVVSENLTDAEAGRWAAAGYDLVFEELAMECLLAGDLPPARWPHGTAILEWSAAAASASFAVYEAAFRSRPGFPGLSESEWIDRQTGDPMFLPAASLCAVRDGEPIGFVISGTGWIGQVGVDPVFRRTGLATALVTEARARMQALGIGVVYLHVNRNNPAGLATWQHLGWRECGRRGRFERALTSDVADTI
jgi:ribosomal protein S18 acetylase RimI-like enzyme